MSKMPTRWILLTGAATALTLLVGCEKMSLTETPTLLVETPATKMPASQTVTPASMASASDDTVDGWAVLAQKDDYSDVNMTDLPVNYIGITQMSQILEDAGWNLDHIHELREFDREALQKDLDWLEESADEDDVVFLYVASHGKYLSDVVLWDEFFASEWKQIPSHRRLLVVDSCQAANFTGAVTGDPLPYLSIAAVARNEFGWSGLEEEGLPIIGGVFTHYFADAFDDPGADADGNGIVSVQEAALMAEDQQRAYMHDVVFAVPDFLEMYRAIGVFPDRDPTYPNVVVDDTIDEPLYLKLDAYLSTNTPAPLASLPSSASTPTTSARQPVSTSTSTPNRIESYQTAADDTTVGLYAGGGAASECVQAAQKMFEWMGYTVTRLDSDTVNRSEISHIDVIYFPGGSAGHFQEDISAEGRDKIRQLVHSGGCFIGTCAGALFAAERIIWEGEADPRPTLGLFPGTVEGPLPEIYTDHEHGMCQVNLEPHPITGTKPDPAWILYYNGPFFSPNLGAEVDVVGRYEITDDPALVAFEYGGGRVFLTGPHPEWEEDDDRDGVSYFDRFSDQGSDWDLMLSATRWCLREIDTLTPPATPKPTPTLMPTAPSTSLLTNVLLEPMKHQAQTHNN
ncbi:MAG: BPL-N domain-containing protein [Chloroflexota bacterium]|nr:BPL-N domain-containing protein [Chloroflexota bacterium]